MTRPAAWRPGVYVACVLGVDKPVSWTLTQAAVLASDKILYFVMNKAKITVAKLDRDAYNKSRSSPNPNKD